MTILAAVLAVALTRAELIDRMRAAPIIKLEGLVQVVGDCPADMRREYMAPVATLVADVCSSLYGMEKLRPRHFDSPGVVVYLGDERTNRTEVVVAERQREGSGPYMFIRLPAPAFSDVAALRRAAAKGFYLAVKGERVSDEEADRAVRQAIPELRIAALEAELEDWLAGRPVPGDDEKYMKLFRTVLRPGRAVPADVLRFAGRLYIYPRLYARPFCGRYAACSFADAIDMAAKDPRIRLQAYLKIPSLVTFGGGRGETFAAAVDAYVAFLRELTVYKKAPGELRAMLDDADAKLKAALEEARKVKEGTLQ